VRHSRGFRPQAEERDSRGFRLQAEVIALVLLATAGCSQPVTHAGWAPNRPIEFVVAAGAGGGSDQLARTVQAIIQKHKLIASPVIVTNKGGGSGSQAFVYAKGTAGDPHKVVFATNNVWLLPLGSAVGYVWSDLQPVAAVAFDEFMLWVNSTAPYQTVAGFLEAARNPGTKLAIAGTASKDTDQVLVRQIEKMGHVAFAYVPFRQRSRGAACRRTRCGQRQQSAGEHRAVARRHNSAALCLLARAAELRRRRHREAIVGGYPDLQRSGAAD
jgi:tripartite-type tricarboxylate transporter receptor subunit TctC